MKAEPFTLIIVIWEAHCGYRCWSEYCVERQTVHKIVLCETEDLTIEFRQNCDVNDKMAWIRSIYGSETSNQSNISQRARW